MQLSFYGFPPPKEVRQNDFPLSPAYRLFSLIALPGLQKNFSPQLSTILLGYSFFFAPSNFALSSPFFFTCFII